MNGRKDRSLWKDQPGHIGPGFERLEGCVLYSTLYGESPERFKKEIPFPGDETCPGRELGQMFRKIAWRAVIEPADCHNRARIGGTRYLP